MRHLYECPLRWADMDQLGHVNNVTYADYLQEARADMFAVHAPFAGGEDLAEGVVVVRHEIDYVMPLVFREEPVSIDVWVSDVRAAAFTLAYEVYDERPDGRVVHLRASTVLAPFVFGADLPRRLSAAEREVLDRFREPASARDPLPRDGKRRNVYTLRVRWSDQDAYRHVNNVKYLEFLQESRINYLFELRAQRGWPPVVVARVDLQYRLPMHFRPEPYEVHTGPSRVGASSFTLASDIVDPTTQKVLASGQVVLVCVDPESNAPTSIPDGLRELLAAEAAAG